ncbi:MAG: hypothetical protein JWN28_372 [Candidatus Saccharibacteria bacterium]|nr:hypothetical protein [Candidatus Saccharibacteria bacterium]
MIIYIDTNKYLQFFTPSSEQFKSLEILKNNIKSKDITLLFPRITQDELLRNVFSVQAVYVSGFRKQRSELKINSFAEINAGIKKDIEKKLKVIQDDLKKLETEYLAESEKILNDDIAFFITNSEAPSVDDELFEAAKKRRMLGNPPGKTDSVLHIGDQVVWETILRDYTHDDVVIVSGDKDWANPLSLYLKKPELDDVLKREWKEKSKKKISLETNLSSFVKKNLKSQIPISDEEVERESGITEDTIDTVEVINRLGTINSNPWRGIDFSSINNNIGLADTLQAMHGMTNNYDIAKKAFGDFQPMSEMIKRNMTGLSSVQARMFKDSMPNMAKLISDSMPDFSGAASLMRDSLSSLNSTDFRKSLGLNNDFLNWKCKYCKAENLSTALTCNVCGKSRDEDDNDKAIASNK